jgi:hypothetical protein
MMKEISSSAASSNGSLLYKNKSIYEYTAAVHERVEKERERSLSRVLAGPHNAQSAFNLLTNLNAFNSNNNNSINSSSNNNSNNSALSSAVNEERPWTLPGADITGYYYYYYY